MLDEEPDRFQWLADLCLKAEGVDCDLMWGNELVFRTGDAMFCLFHIEAGRKVSVAFRPAPGNRDALLAHPHVEAAAFPADGGWLYVTEDAKVSRDELDEWIRDSYKLARSENANAA